MDNFQKHMYVLVYNHTLSIKLCLRYQIWPQSFDLFLYIVRCWCQPSILMQPIQTYALTITYEDATIGFGILNNWFRLLWSRLTPIYLKIKSIIRDRVIQKSLKCIWPKTFCQDSDQRRRRTLIDTWFRREGNHSFFSWMIIIVNVYLPTMKGNKGELHERYSFEKRNLILNRTIL